jgi:hypothetical protein
MEYPCHSPNEQRWFLLQVTPLAEPFEGAVLTHVLIPVQDRDEVLMLESTSGYSGVPTTNRILGLAPLSETSPDAFRELAEAYSVIVDGAINTALNVRPAGFSESIRRLAGRLGTLRATPKDVTDVHIAALRAKMGESPTKKAGFQEESRYVLIELLGSVAAFYRTQSMGTAARSSVEKDAERGQG